MWLSRIPAVIPGHFHPLRSTGQAREAFERQAAVDWEQFLTARAGELVPGGRLVVVVPAVSENDLSGFEEIVDCANLVLAEMVREGSLTIEERARMVIGSHARHKKHLLAPFSERESFRGFIVEAFEESVLVDAAWTDYEKDGDRRALAQKHAAFFRAVFSPALAAALTQVWSGNPEASSAFGDRLQEGLFQRLIEQPVSMHSLVHTLVLAKQE